MNLSLSKEEAALIERLLRADLGDLKVEIGKTENYDWRVEMKQDQEMLIQIIGRLEAATAAAA
jgi:hypothetical protein